MALSARFLPGEVFDTVGARGDDNYIKSWLEHCGDPDLGIQEVLTSDYEEYAAGTTLLMVAAYRGRLDVVRLLIDHGADVNVRLPVPDDGRSALAFAISY